MKDLNQTKALIVGGSSGIGLATARYLNTRGIHTVLIGSSADKLTTAKNSLDFPSQADTLQADLYLPEDVQRIVDFVCDPTTHVKYLINAAGKFTPTVFLEHSSADYDKYMDLNRAAFFISQAVARNMISHGNGAIVNIGSMWAKQGIKATPSSAYSMAKAGLHALTQHMAMELADYNIRVNAVAPAVVKTPIYESFIDPNEVDAVLSTFDKFHPIGRTGSPDDVAAVIDFLLDDKSSWVTGTVWDVDGGVMAGRN
ncbi:MAG: SDR family oxidoreductase [Oceanospirillaceae bacterium]|nr:SDR family oxidoreductase [Oceanospirillaceae bacterium]